MRLETGKFNAAVDAFARAARMDIVEATKKQAGVLTGYVMACTPPATAKGTEKAKLGMSEKKAGESTIASDIESLFIGTRAPEKVLRAWVHEGIKPGWLKGAAPRGYVMDAASMAKWHRASRSTKTGRTFGGKWGGAGVGRANMNVAWAPPSLIKRYVREQKKKVGRLNSGWLRAAHALGTSRSYIPGWVERFPEEGGLEIEASRDVVKITISNTFQFNAADMDKRIRWALKRAETSVLKQIDAALKYRARKGLRS